MTLEERPIEPNNTAENPGQWAAIADWEYERAEQLQRERDEAVELLREHLLMADAPPAIEGRCVGFLARIEGEQQ